MNNASFQTLDSKSGDPSGSSIVSASNNHRPFLLLCLLVFLVVLGLTALTPMVSDDFAYCFSFADWTRIRHMGQIIPSMAEHRNVTNGRVIVHGLVQLLLLLPRPVYCVLNALNADPSNDRSPLSEAGTDDSPLWHLLVLLFSSGFR